MKKVDRNAPCPCGSGKKYKQCCLKRDEAVSTSKPAASFSTSTVLQEAIAHHQAGRLFQAESLYQQILAIEPDHHDALHLLGVLAHQTGNNELAIELIGKAIRANPANPMCYMNLGNALKGQGQFDAAAQSYQMALAHKPDFAEAHYHLGLVLQAQGQLGEAVESYLKALSLRSNYAEAHNNLGLTLQGLNKLDVAVEHYINALSFNPSYAEAHNNLGLALHEQGKLGAAVEQYHKAISIKPDFAEAHYNLGNSLHKLGKLDNAVKSYHQALSIKPDYAEGHYNLGLVLREQNKLDTAAESYLNAISFKPDYAEAFNNLGLVLHEQGKPDDAVAQYRKALSFRTDFAEVLNNLGRALHAQGKLDEAIINFHQALSLKQEFSDARSNLGLTQLSCGQVAEGWRNYESRSAIDTKRFSHLLRWSGENLDDKSILIWGEQGIGDEIMFAGMYSEIIVRVRRCVIECAAKLVPLFARSFPNAQIVPKTEPPHLATQVGIDYQCAAGSLARWLRPNLESFPRHGRILEPDPGRVTYWKTRLAELGPGAKIGFSWRSGVITSERAQYCTTLDQWGPVFATQGAHFVSLQYDECSAELNEARQRFGVPLHSFAEVDMYNDLDETAALVRALDLVITAPTAVFCIAAAVGVDTWVMYRGAITMSLGTDHHPWFPTLRCFNKRWDQTWDETFERISRELKSHAWQ